MHRAATEVDGTFTLRNKVKKLTRVVFPVKMMR
jgi:hypothetical protein